MRYSQDGVRIRAGAGASNFRRESTLDQLLADAGRNVEDLARQVADPENAAAVGSRKAAATKRAAKGRAQRLKQAIAQMPELKRKQAVAAELAGTNGKRG